jgi:hypothetical protein
MVVGEILESSLSRICGVGGCFGQFPSIARELSWRCFTHCHRVGVIGLLAPTAAALDEGALIVGLVERLGGGGWLRFSNPAVAADERALIVGLVERLGRGGWLRFGDPAVALDERALIVALAVDEWLLSVGTTGLVDERLVARTMVALDERALIVGLVERLIRNGDRAMGVLVCRLRWSIDRLEIVRMVSHRPLAACARWMDRAARLASAWRRSRNE